MSIEIITTKLNRLNITNLQGEKQSLENIFVTFNIYESIFENFKLGKIQIKDTFDIINTFPILGGEEIEIYYTSDNDAENQKSKIQKFKVYNIETDSNIQQQEDNKKLITIYFCSPEMLIDKKTSVSRRFTIDTEDVFLYIIKSIFASPKEFFMDEVDNKLDFITNFWTPSKIIRYLENHSENTANDFLFFENINGFNFKSLSNLMNKEASHELYFSDGIEMLYDYNSVKGKIMKKYFNDLEGLQFGTYGNTFYKINPSYYGYNKYQQDFHTITKFNTSLGKFVQHREELLNNNNINLTFNDADHLSKRDMILKSLSKYHQILKMNGDSTKTVGQIINFKIDLRLREEINPNELLDGKWFITNINHKLSNDGTYEQTIKIVKNAFLSFKYFNKTQGVQNL